MLNNRSQPNHFLPEIIDIVYKNLKLSTTAVVVSIIILYIVLFNSIDSMVLNLWFISSVLITLARFYTAYYYEKNKELWSIEVWEKTFLIGVVLGSLIWAVLPFFVFESKNVLEHAMLMFVIAGITAGSIASLSAYHIALKLFIILTLIPYVAKLVTLEENIYHYLGLLVLLYLFMLIEIAQKFYINYINYLQSKQEAALSNQNLEFANQAFYDVLGSLDADVILLDSKLNIIKHTDGTLDDFFEISKYKNFSDIDMDRLAIELPNISQDIEEALLHNRSVGYDIEYHGDNYYLTIKPINLSIDRDKELQEGVVISFVDTTELIRKDRILFQHSKMASMGEMIGNIAHQWNQPLTALSNKVSDVYIKYQLKEINDKAMESFIADSSQLIQKMSDTINDFKNFFKPNKAKTKFLVSSVIHESIALTQDSFENSDIEVRYYKNEDYIMETYKNELIQVLVNLLNNAIDAINVNRIDAGYVEISSTLEGNCSIITVVDNGGGIDPSTIDRVFEPYFSTKFQDDGTGLGLYMSKMIIEDSMHGKISLQNHEDGVLATITIEQNL